MMTGMSNVSRVAGFFTNRLTWFCSSSCSRSEVSCVSSRRILFSRRNLISSGPFHQTPCWTGPSFFCLTAFSRQASEAHGVPPRPAPGGAEVPRRPAPPGPLLAAPRPGAPPLLSALRPARLPGVRRRAAPRPRLPARPRRRRAPRGPHPGGGGGAPATAHGAAEGVAAEGAAFFCLLRLRRVHAKRPITSPG